MRAVRARGPQQSDEEIGEWRRGKAVVVGRALGMIGRNIIQALEAEGGWEIIGPLQGGPANFETGATFISVDLLDDAPGERGALGPHRRHPHLLRGALRAASRRRTSRGNLKLVTNSVGVIEPVSPLAGGA